MSVQTRSYHDYRSDELRVKCQCSDCGNAWEVTPFDRKDCPKCSKEHMIIRVHSSVVDHYSMSTRMRCKCSVCGHNWEESVSYGDRPTCPQCKARQTAISDGIKAGVYPPRPGRYLTLAYEWPGLERDKPKEPDWTIRTWDGRSWSKARYGCDTGGYESLEIVRWQELPPTTP